MNKLRNEVKINIQEQASRPASNPLVALNRLRPTHYLPPGMQPNNKYKRAVVDALLIGAGVQIFEAFSGYNLLTVGIVSVKNAFDWMWTTDSVDNKEVPDTKLCFSKYDRFTKSGCIAKMRECYHFSPELVEEFCSLDITGINMSPD